jgi:hypothetical protein
MQLSSSVHKEKLGQLIVHAGLATQEDIDHALKSQRVFGGSLGTNLVEMGVVDDVALSVFLSKQLGIARAQGYELSNIPDDVLSTIPRKAAQALGILPLQKKEDQVLAVAMSDPTDQHIISKIQENIAYTIEPKIAPELQIYKGLKKHYDIPLAPRVMRLLHHQKKRIDASQQALIKHLNKTFSSDEALTIYFGEIENLQKVPVIDLQDDIKSYDLSPELIFLFQLIDGVSSLQDMIDMSVFGKLTTLRAMIHFYKLDMIELTTP